MVWSRTTLAATFLVSVITGYVVLGAGSRPAYRQAGPAATPRPINQVSIHISPLYPAPVLFDHALQLSNKTRTDLDNPISGAIVNHHLLVPQFIADTLSYARGQSIDRIILLAPNHFFAGHGYFITTNAIFSTPYGDVETDNSFFNAMMKSGGLVNNAEPFQQEHGIYNILPFLHQQFPDVPVIPIITRDGTPISQVDLLRRHLEKLMTPRTLAIASLDFAHNQTNQGAQLLDQTSLKKLMAVDQSAVQPNVDDSIAVDSPMTLRLFLGLMRDRQATAFTLTHHSNSALETGHLEATNVTSYITGLFRIPSVKQ